MGDLDKIWDKVKGPLGKIAPLLGTAIMGPGGAAVGSLVANVLGTEDEPESIAKALEGATPDQKAKLIELQENNRHELAKLTLQKAISDNELDASTIGEVNQSIRVEAQQGHKWSGAWRPFWGFASAIAFVIAVVGIIILAAYAISTKQFKLLEYVPTLTFQLAALFTIPGAILGVASWHRGRKQRIEAGETARPGLMDAVVSRIGKV
jgi:hypothetical protein